MKSDNLSYTFSAMVVLILSITGVILLDLPIYMGLLSTLVYLIGLTVFRGFKFGIVMGMVLKKMRTVDYVAGMMLMIGGLVALWMQTGTIPALIYIGFKYLVEFNLILTTYLICMAMSLMIGSAIGTLSTIGLVFLAVGQGIGIPSGLMVGAIASGAYVGDRMSPLASGGNLAAAAAGAKLPDVLRRMFKSNWIWLIVVGGVYFIIGSSFEIGPKAITSLELVTSAIEIHYDLTLLLMIPLVALLASILVFKLGIIKSLGIASVISVLIGLGLQGQNFLDLLNHYMNGYVSPSPELSHLIKGGGINSMWSVVLAILFSAGINGILEGTDMIHPLLDRWIGLSKSPGKLMRKTIYTCVVVTILTCNQSLTALLTGSYFSDKFEAHGYDRADLARIILDTGILMVALIPWNVNAIFFKSVTGVSTIAYGPHAYYLWIVPLATLASTFFIKSKSLAVNEQKTGCKSTKV